MEFGSVNTMPSPPTMSSHDFEFFSGFFTSPMFNYGDVVEAKPNGLASQDPSGDVNMCCVFAEQCAQPPRAPNFAHRAPAQPTVSTLRPPMHAPSSLLLNPGSSLATFPTAEPPTFPSQAIISSNPDTLDILDSLIVSSPQYPPAMMAPKSPPHRMLNIESHPSNLERPSSRAESSSRQAIISSNPDTLDISDSLIVSSPQYPPTMMAPKSPPRRMLDIPSNLKRPSSRTDSSSRRAINSSNPDTLDILDSLIVKSAPKSPHRRKLNIASHPSNLKRPSLRTDSSSHQTFNSSNPDTLDILDSLIVTSAPKSPHCRMPDIESHPSNLKCPSPRADSSSRQAINSSNPDTLDILDSWIVTSLECPPAMLAPKSPHHRMLDIESHPSNPKRPFSRTDSSSHLSLTEPDYPSTGSSITGFPTSPSPSRSPQSASMSAETDLETRSLDLALLDLIGERTSDDEGTVGGDSRSSPCGDSRPSPSSCFSPSGEYSFQDLAGPVPSVGTGSGSVSDDQPLRFSCPTGTDLRLIIKPPSLLCLTCGSTPSPSSSHRGNLYTVKISMQHQTSKTRQPGSTQDSETADKASTARVTRSSATTNPKAKQKPAVSTGRKASVTKGTPAPKAKKATLPASKQPPRVSGTARQAQDPPSAPPVRPTVKNQAQRQSASANAKKATNRTTDEDTTMDEDVDGGSSQSIQKRTNSNRMNVDQPTVQPRGPSTLKRKPSGPRLRTDPTAEDTDFDDIDDVPRPKKSKSSAAAKQMGANKGLQSPAVSLADLPSTVEPSSKAPKKGPAPTKAAVVAAERVVLQKENEALKAQLAARDAEVLRLQHLNSQAQHESRPNQLIPRPPGERGKKGWNLQKHMGLEDDCELYSNIRRCVRYAVYESQLNIWRRINRQDEMGIFTCYALVKKRFPFMGRFEGNWATREFIKGICQNARRHCRRRGISDPTLPIDFLSADGDKIDNDNGEDDDDNNDEGNGNGDGDEEDEDEEDGDEDEDGEPWAGFDGDGLEDSDAAEDA